MSRYFTPPFLMISWYLPLPYLNFTPPFLMISWYLPLPYLNFTPLFSCLNIYSPFLMSQYLPSFSHVSVLSLLFSCLGTYPSFSHVPVFTPPFLMSRYFTLLLLAAPTQLMSKKEYIIYVRSFFISILRVSFYIFLFITCLH
uniref:Uncharacterized protein n=1 Tax=Cacopsylla melanoneura TaxID=428564 RepID=A0A8D9B002_9HEMI